MLPDSLKQGMKLFIPTFIVFAVAFYAIVEVIENGI